MKAKDKKRALMLLKINKFKTKALDDIQSQLLNLEQLIMGITTQEEQIKVVEGLKAGNMALKKLQSQMPIEEVEKVRKPS